MSKESRLINSLSKKFEQRTAIGTDIFIPNHSGIDPSRFESKIAHSMISGLLNDDHTQYALLAGRSGGQIITGGTDSAETLTLKSNAVDSFGAVIDTTALVTSDVTFTLPDVASPSTIAVRTDLDPYALTSDLTAYAKLAGRTGTITEFSGDLTLNRTVLITSNHTVKNYQGLEVSMTPATTGVNTQCFYVGGNFGVNNIGVNLTGASSINFAAGIYGFANLGYSITATTTSLYGLYFQAAGNVGGASVVTELASILVLTGMGKIGVVAGTPNVVSLNGAIFSMNGSTDVNATTVRGILFKGDSQPHRLTTTVAAIDISNTWYANFTASATKAVTTWSAFRVPVITGPATIWGLDFTGTMNNRLAGKIAIGTTTAPTYSCDVTGDINFTGSLRTNTTAGITVVINTAPLNIGGAAGTMTFTNGILTAQVQST